MEKQAKRLQERAKTEAKRTKAPAQSPEQKHRLRTNKTPSQNEPERTQNPEPTQSPEQKKRGVKPLKKSPRRFVK